MVLIYEEFHFRNGFKDIVQLVAQLAGAYAVDDDHAVKPLGDGEVEVMLELIELDGQISRGFRSRQLSARRSIWRSIS